MSAPSTSVLERNVRDLCRRFGVDENLPPRDRAMAINRAVAAAGGLGAGYRAARASPQTADREPGSDDE